MMGRQGYTPAARRWNAQGTVTRLLVYVCPGSRYNGEAFLAMSPQPAHMRLFEERGVFSSRRRSTISRRILAGGLHGASQLCVETRYPLVGACGEERSET